MAAFASLIAVASCNKEPVQPEVQTPVEPEFQTVTFDVAVPGGEETKTSYGETVNFDVKLKAMVYVGNTGDVQEDDLNIFGVPGTYLPDVATEIVQKTKTSWEVKLTLVKNYHYDIVFWAQAATGAPYSIDWANAKITADYTVSANNINRDAFYYLCQDYCYLDAEKEGNAKIVLTRPLAQINIGSADYDELAALYKKAGKDSDLQTKISSSAKVPSVLNLLTGRADKEVAVDFALAPTTPADGSYDLVAEENDIEVAGQSYTLVGTNYVFANPIAENPTADITLTFAYNGKSFTVDVPNAPYARNYQTNILGNFFTSANEFEVIIKPGFDGKEHVFVVTDEDMSLAEAMSLGDDVTYTLTQDHEISQPLILDNGKTFTLNLEGKTISNSVALWGEAQGIWSMVSVAEGSTLVINAEDGAFVAMKDDCYAVDVRGGNLVINGGKFVGNISAVYVYEGSAEINGGEFSIQQLSEFADERYTLNCYDDNYKANKASIIVTGGSFMNFNPADNGAEGPATSFVAEGYESVAVDNADGSVTYTVAAKTNQD